MRGRCYDSFFKQKIMTASLSVTEVYGIVRDAVAGAAPLGRVEYAPLARSANRFLAEDIRAPFCVPQFDNAAMDGFAFRFSDLKPGADGSASLRIAGAAYAGHPFESKLGPGEAIRIMTGAPTPEGADTVIAHEHTTWTEQTVVFAADAVERGANVRVMGEEMTAGEIILPKGTLLTPAHVGLLASLGIDRVPVRAITVAVFATGDELREPGETLPAGAIYNSNTHLIAALASSWGADVLELGILPDELEAQERALGKALLEADFLITSGGVGEGDKDFTTRALSKLGDVTHYFVRMRPGKPFTWGELKTNERTVFFAALPGNPVAAAMSASLLLRPALSAAAGLETKMTEVTVKAAAALKGRAGRTDFIRGTLDAQGFHPAKHQSSAMLTTLAGMNAAAVLPEGVDRVEAGADVRVLMLD